MNILLTGVCKEIVNNLADVNEPRIYTITKIANSNDKGYQPGHSFIINGGNDLYDLGNYIKVPSNSSNYVRYLQNCEEGSVSSETYWMAMNPQGISVTLFHLYGEESISVDGGLGLDGHGSVFKGLYAFNGWNGYWKIAHAGSTWEPSLHHLFVTDAQAIHAVSSTTNEDFDELTKVKGHTIVYLMWATQHGYKSSEDVVQQLVRAVVNEFN